MTFTERKWTIFSDAVGWSKGDAIVKILDMLYEGKAKRIYATEDPNLLVMNYKDEATAFDGAKKGIIASKGIVNNRVSCLLFNLLEKHGVATHLVKQLDERNVLVRRMEMIPLEVVVRNVVAGSLAKGWAGKKARFCRCRLLSCTTKVTNSMIPW